MMRKTPIMLLNSLNVVGGISVNKEAKNSCISLPVQPLIPPFPDSPEEHIQKSKQILEKQVLKINQLSQELEQAIWQLKAIALQINQEQRFLFSQQQKLGYKEPICEYRSVEVPAIYRKPGGCFVLKSYTVDLFRAEKEATILAQELRQRRYKKHQ
jgi:hypothetical protein